jgi:type I site-specific restriction endonuclease
VEKYEFHQTAYKRGQFNETQIRREFVDPFFRSLGWEDKSRHDTMAPLNDEEVKIVEAAGK